MTRHFLLRAAAGALLAPQLLIRETLAQTSVQRTQETSSSGAAVAYTTEAVATVESIDQRSREVLLRGSGGQLFTVVAGPAVENLARVKAGDRVVIRYVEALAVSLAKPGQGGTVVEQGDITRRPPDAVRPAGAIRNQIRTTVTIDAIDRATHTVTFTGPSNAVRTVAVKEPEGKRFVETLKPGDRVDMVYTESLAIAVEPMGQ